MTFEAPFLLTLVLTQDRFGNTRFKVGQQNDAPELLQYLIDALHQCQGNIQR